ncbi:hypothetical protein FACS189492_1000 [Clostridia bacterium]|nr:hypothetical protein FACS189492_1000 [Clostridia bacterium]
MKVKSKALAFVLAFTVLVSTLGMGTGALASSFTDVEDAANYASAVELLVALKIINGYNEGGVVTFKPEGDITRAEFAAVIVRALGQELSAGAASGATDYDDVPADHWASGYINVASKLRIINGFGDGNFGPEQNVTYEQAVKMVVCALGYEPLALSLAGNDPGRVWPEGYIGAASQLNLLTGLTGSGETPAKRWVVARLVFNALEVKLMETVEVNGTSTGRITDKTVLGDYLKVKYDIGTLVANTASSVLASGAKSRAGEVYIKGGATADDYDAFNDGGVKTEGLVGHVMKYYYTQTVNDVKTLVFVEDRVRSSLTIDAELLDLGKSIGQGASLASGGDLWYYETENATRSTRVSIGRNPSVTVNGVIVSNPKGADLQPLTGEIELIDSTNTGNYDLINVTKYDTYVVRDANTTDYKVIDQYRPVGSPDQFFEANPDDASMKVTIKSTTGSILDFGSLRPWTVLSVRKSVSASRTSIDITVSTATVTGTVTEVDGDHISINGKVYRISRYYTEYGNGQNGADQIKMDDSGTFYLDKDNKIAGFRKSAAADSKYGFLLGVQDNRSSGTISVKLLTALSAGSIVQYTSGSRVRLNGDKDGTNNSYNAEETKNKIFELYGLNTSEFEPDNRGELDAKGNPLFNLPSESVYRPMLVKYAVNTSNELTQISTVTGTETTKVETPADGKMTYNSNSRQFSGGGKQFLINNSTHVFVLPGNRLSDTDYKHSTGYGYFKNGVVYTVRAYDAPSGSSTAGVVVVFGGAETKISAQSPIGIIRSIASVGESTSGKDGYNRRVELYMFGYGHGIANPSVTLFAESEIDSLKVGDVIKYETTGNYIELFTPAYTIGNAAHKPNPGNYPEDNSVTDELFAGSLNKVETDDDGNYTVFVARDAFSVVETPNNYTFTTSGATQIVLYDVNAALEQRVTLQNPSYLVTLPNFASTGTVPQEVFVFTASYSGGQNVGVMYVIKR